MMGSLSWEEIMMGSLSWEEIIMGKTATTYFSQRQ
jgi:hypothetical protein